MIPESEDLPEKRKVCLSVGKAQLIDYAGAPPIGRFFAPGAIARLPGSAAGCVQGRTYPPRPKTPRCCRKKLDTDCISITGMVENPLCLFLYYAKSQMTTILCAAKLASNSILKQKSLPSFGGKLSYKYGFIFNSLSGYHFLFGMIASASCSFTPAFTKKNALSTTMMA
ncbi:hypothetical protein LJC56_00410 [Christensenellaceae bacterium OttesenSCG-928-K19]|nr:hypothetical protein [Christensenellaceae bacterium OttesenSCG-928-K19]